MVPIGRHAFEYRRWFVPPINRSIEEEHRVQVLVRDNNVDQALKVLKKKMQREGVFREMKLRGHYEKPFERRIREGRKPSAAPASSPAKSCSTRVCCR
jgi:ribosomal protein S21